MKFDPRNSRWVAYLNLAAAIITVTGLGGGFTLIPVLEPLQQILPVPVWLIFVGFIFIPSLTILISRYLSKKSDPRLDVLHKIISHPEMIKIVDSNGREYIGGHAENFYWKEVATAICKGMELSNLRYSNIGTQYHLENITTRKKIEIPTDNFLEEKITKTGARNGQVLLIVENV